MSAADRVAAAVALLGAVGAIWAAVVAQGARKDAQKAAADAATYEHQTVKALQETATAAQGSADALGSLARSAAPWRLEWLNESGDYLLTNGSNALAVTTSVSVEEFPERFAGSGWDPAVRHVWGAGEPEVVQHLMYGRLTMPDLMIVVRWHWESEPENEARTWKGMLKSS